MLISALLVSPSEAGAETLQGLHARPPMVGAPLPVVAVIGGLLGPESALHDADQDVYFISNIHGGELDADDNGFISRVDAKTLGVDVRWIEGGRDGVQLDCPKGLTILGEVLYVADRDGVRLFDRRTGAPRGFVALPGATFVNDLATDGRSVYVTDTGYSMGPGDAFVPTGTDAAWRIDATTATRIASGDSLQHPNGIAWSGGRLLVATFGSNELLELNAGGGTKVVARLPEGELDGIAELADGSLLVASWQGDAIYRGRRGGPFTPILVGIDMPADIGYDATRSRLLVPHSGAGEVTIHQLP